MAIDNHSTHFWAIASTMGRSQFDRGRGGKESVESMHLEVKQWQAALSWSTKTAVIIVLLGVATTAVGGANALKFLFEFFVYVAVVGVGPWLWSQITASSDYERSRKARSAKKKEDNRPT